MKEFIELKKTGRFSVKFPEQFNIEDWTIIKINKPKFHEGKWENITVEFIDPVEPSVSKSLLKIVEFLKTAKTNNDKTLFVVRIKSMDTIGKEIEEWIVSVENVLTINFGELNYGIDEIQKPYLTFKPLNCVLK